MRSFRCACLLFVAALFALTTPAAAQEVDWHRFYPLEEGDTWIYRFYEQECPTEAGECSGEVDRLITRTVVGSVDVEGTARPLVRAEVRTAPEQPPTCVADYAVWRDEETAEVRIEPQGSPCSYAYRQEPFGTIILENQAPLEVGSREEQGITIGGVPYTLLTHASSRGPGLSDTYFTFGYDVGLVDLYSMFHLGGSGQNTFTSYGLRYAEVDGVVYGTLPVANEGGSAPAAFTLSAAYPNPFRSTVTLALNLPTAEPVTLEAFDVLGRRVLERDLGVQSAGTSRHTISGATLPPGVYFVRVTTTSGQSATRRIVRVE